LEKRKFAVDEDRFEYGSG